MASATDLLAVVRTMKAVAAASIGSYEQAVRALGDYYKTLQWGLSACLREQQHLGLLTKPAAKLSNTANSHPVIQIIVFGSDQGLVGQFNDAIAERAMAFIRQLAEPVVLWVVGERARLRLEDSGFGINAFFNVPTSIESIAPLIERMQLAIQPDTYALYLFHHQTQSSDGFIATQQQLLPLDNNWQMELLKTAWPTKNLPQIIYHHRVYEPETSLATERKRAEVASMATLHKLIHEYLFIALYKACAESQGAENASRLSAMERAEKNIEELLNNQHNTYHRLRQNAIDEELFDVITGYEALSAKS
jgi:F-type H+-transporting ATPase subunit gamma